jgi:hypothetical protein
MSIVYIINLVFKIQSKKRDEIAKKSQNKKYKPLNVYKVERFNWDDKLKNNMKFFYPPRFLIVEVY